MDTYQTRRPLIPRAALRVSHSIRTVSYRIAKEILIGTPLRRFFFPFFGYNMTAAQLVFLCESLDRTRTVPGVFVEVGCSTGMTTVFLNKYMDSEGIDREYVAIDTFAGFVEADVRYELEQRDKQALFFSGFKTNKRKWFDKTIQMNGISRVRSIEADVNSFDFSLLKPIALCLLDVDLYRPTKRTLSDVYRRLSPGGLILVDDCDPSNVRWDGADQAYKEFCAELPCCERVVSGIGIVEKPLG